MKIEVATAKSSPAKERGDLLEKLAKYLLQAQSYEVIEEIRFTGVELDLLCKHKVNNKQIYVECKAYRDKTIDANVLKNLAGTLFFKEYSEAWLLSTAAFGKEAKGFIAEWQEKPAAVASRLSFYQPHRIIEALVSASVIKPQPTAAAVEYIGSTNLLGEWVLLVTSYGTFWVTPTLSGGIPNGVLCYYANNNELLTDSALLERLKATDTSLNELDFTAPKSKKAKIAEIETPKMVGVVQVQTGEAWSDYRPARPEDFVGRSKDITSIFSFFKKVRDRETNTRIFAVTGNSGMGKSSLIAKLHSKARNQQNKHRYFVFPVDLRAATGAEYVYSSLLKALKSAQRSAFGDSSIQLILSDVGNPLNSESIRSYLESVDENNQLIALVFDQFEELYSKQELFGVFESTKQLLLDAAALDSNFCLGFAWKTDSTTQNEHPAYFLWHELADYRITRKLSPFSESESNAAINIFEKELEQKLHNDLRHNLVASSQGYPWLLKKLCIHLYDKIQDGTNQYDLLENKLDVASLFEEDLRQLTPAESACLKVVAKKAPVDWFEIIEISGPDTLNSLINRRLVIRSGDRLNVYWDIFREYVLTGSVPVIPLRYLPSTDFSSLYKVAKHLDHGSRLSVQDLVAVTSFSEGTVQNIGSDMIMFGVADREAGLYSLNVEVSDGSEVSLLRAIRRKFGKHVFTHALQERSTHSRVTVSSLIDLLRTLYPDSKYANNTWRAYTIRLCRWLELCGFIENWGSGWIFRDQGDVVTNRRKSERRRRKSNIFTAPASPALAVETLNWLSELGTVHNSAEELKGYRNAIAVLKRFELLAIRNGTYSLDSSNIRKFPSFNEAIWICANAESVLLDVVKVLEVKPDLSGKDVGEYLAEKHELSWTEGSKLRNGSAIRQWAQWLHQGKLNSEIPPAPGRVRQS